MNNQFYWLNLLVGVIRFKWYFQKSCSSFDFHMRCRISEPFNGASLACDVPFAGTRRCLADASGIQKFYDNCLSTSVLINPAISTLLCVMSESSNAFCLAGATLLEERKMTLASQYQLNFWKAHDYARSVINQRKCCHDDCMIPPLNISGRRQGC